MEKVFVATLMNSSSLLLLFEMGLDDRTNVAFDMEGRTLTLGGARFDPDSEREIELGSQEITDAQRRAYSRFAQADLKNKAIEDLERFAALHPFRQDVERFGGEFLPQGFYKWCDAIERLEAWLKQATNEDVIGNIGTFAGRAWIETFVPGIDGGLIGVRFNTDTRAKGLKELLKFVKRCGGPEAVHGERVDGKVRLFSAEGASSFEGAEYLYMYYSP